MIFSSRNSHSGEWKFIKIIFQFENKDQLYEHLVECDVIVYDITEDPDQIDEAVWAVSGKVFVWLTVMYFVD